MTGTGAFATALAEQRPGLVTALVLINTGPDMAAYTAKEVPIRAASTAELTDDQIRQAMSDGFRPGATVQMLPGVGHSPSLDDPALTAVPLLAFTTASH